LLCHASVQASTDQAGNVDLTDTTNGMADRVEAGE
jgi:hypothetical protein